MWRCDTPTCANHALAGSLLVTKQENDPVLCEVLQRVTVGLIQDYVAIAHHGPELKALLSHWAAATPRWITVLPLDAAMQLPPHLLD